VPRTPVLDCFRPAFHAACRAYFGLELHGVDNIPGEGSVIIAWSRLFTIPVFAGFIRRLRAFPVDIEATDTRAIREAARLLRAGDALMIFPEGGRTPDGSLQPFKIGAFRLAVAHDTPVLPVTIRGGFEAWPPGRTLPGRGRIRIMYHPIERPTAAKDRREAALDLRARVIAKIASALR
jgi:1-acyl-sn-glycerol-3-phosphate acyltransferase